MSARTTLVSWLNTKDFGDEILAEGWPHFIETRLHRELEWFKAGGIEQCRFILHDPGFAPCFDQWLSEDGTLPRLRDEFAEAWRPVVEAGHEVMCFLGPLRWIDPERDPFNPQLLDNVKLGELAKPFCVGEWLDRVNRSIAPAVAARCSIIFASLSEVTPRHPAYHLIALLRSMGTRCYVEPAPRVTDDNLFGHWYESPMMMMDDALDRSNLSTYRQRFSGELVRACPNAEANAVAQAERITRILSDGHTAAFRVIGAPGIAGTADLGVACKDLLAPASFANVTSAPAT